MKKSEALALQTSLEKELSAVLRESCEISLALCGGLRVSFECGFINFEEDLKSVDWIKWNGWYDTLLEMLGEIRFFFERKRDDVHKLIWSYEHRKELEE